MRKIFTSVIAISSAIMAMVSCQVEIDDPATVSDSSHTVTIVSEISENPSTKVNVTEDDGKAVFSWSSNDYVSMFHVYENGVGATSVTKSLGSDGIMSLTATFDGKAEDKEYTYSGFFSKYNTIDEDVVYALLEGAQNMTNSDNKNSFDRQQMILVAEPLTTAESTIVFKYKRVVAVNKMTVKGLSSGEDIASVTISSEAKNLTGKYNYKAGEWITNGNTITVTVDPKTVTKDSEGNPIIYFTCAPVSGAMLSFTATTTAGKSYTKTLTKPVSFAEGSYNTFSVTVESEDDVPPVEPAYVKITSAPTDWTGRYLIVDEYVDNNITKAHIFNGVDSASDYDSADINNNVIAYRSDFKAVDITAVNGGYSLKIVNGDKAGNYISGKSGSNTIVYGAEPVANEISYEVENGQVTIISNDTSLRYNATSGNERFRYYKTTTTGSSYHLVYLYKLIGTVEGVDVTNVELDQNEITLEVGDTEALVATVLPENATNKSVTWSSSDEDVATVEDGAVTAVGVGEATITVTTVDGGFTDECVVTVTSPSVSIANTPETAYTPSEAIALIDAGKDLTTPVYVKGIVSKIVTEYNSSYGNISFNVSANGETTEDQFQFYRNFKGADKNKWTDSDATPRVGDSVIGYGKLTKYNSTYEFAEGNYIVSIDRAQYLEASASKTSGISAEGETITITVDTNIDSWSASITGDSTFALDEANKTETTIPVIVSENTDVENGKTATVTITAGDKKVEIELSQLVKTDGGTVTAFEWNGGGKETLNSMDGVTYAGLGSDYAESNAPYRVKLDGTGDYITIHVGYEISSVQLTVKMLGGAETSTIAIQESADGETFADNSLMTISGTQNAVVDFTTSTAFKADSKYVKLYFTKGSNVGIGYIKITPKN